MEGLTPEYQRDGGWWIGYVVELPGANTQGRKFEEVRENLGDAVRLLTETNRELVRRQDERR